MVPHFLQRIQDTIFVESRQDLLVRKVLMNLLTVVTTYYIVVFVVLTF